MISFNSRADNTLRLNNANHFHNSYDKLSAGAVNCWHCKLLSPLMKSLIATVSEGKNCISFTVQSECESLIISTEYVVFSKTDSVSHLI